jgi:hypothetical protein
MLAGRSRTGVSLVDPAMILLFGVRVVRDDGEQIMVVCPRCFVIPTG